MKSGKQEHDGESFIPRHTEFGPQGDGWHGFIGLSGSKAINVDDEGFCFYQNNKMKCKRRFLRLGMHRIKGSPVRSGEQLQIGL